MLEFVRWSTFLATLLMAVFGYSDQLRLVIANKSTEGLSFLMILLGFWVWGSYALYGLLRKDYKIFWPNVIGAVFVGAILISFLFY
ncbi:MAG: SemiSWEET family transporter [bacterium]|nr:SemiSWEET family transporter [bacterium]